ncbi:MAG: tetratricopeptide repeat protein [Myxococcota bacterium]|nr:tetratricopeptide repeat protein [Myxococcota bacterium]
MSDARSVYKAAFQHFANDRFEEAAAGYREAIDLDGGLAIAWNGLSMVLARLGDLEGAIEAGKKLVELEPDDPLSHTNLSRLYQQNGMIPEAEDEAAKAMQLSMNRDGEG